MLNPAQEPVVTLTVDELQWLMARGVVKPGTLSPFFGHPALDDSSQPAYRFESQAAERAVQIVAAPDRKLVIYERTPNEESHSAFFLQRTEAALVAHDASAFAISQPFSNALLLRTLKKKISTGQNAHLAVLPVVLGAFGHHFVSAERSVVGRVPSELERLLGADTLEFLLAEGFLVRHGDAVSPHSDYEQALAALWSGYTLLIEVQQSDAPHQKKTLTFFGPAGERWWSFDDTLPSGEVITHFQSLGDEAAAAMAGDLIGL